MGFHSSCFLFDVDLPYYGQAEVVSDHGPKQDEKAGHLGILFSSGSLVDVCLGELEEKSFQVGIAVLVFSQLIHGAVSDQDTLVDNPHSVADSFGDLQDMCGKRTVPPASQCSRMVLLKRADERGSRPTMGSSRIRRGGWLMYQGRVKAIFVACRGCSF